jgi:DNA-binding transcriptional ArsR family regulator
VTVTLDPSRGAAESTVSRCEDGAPEALRVLDDDHAREILRTLADGPACGRQLSRTCAASRPTVYRRLDRLEDAGLVAFDLRLDADGHHRRRYRLARDRLTVTVEEGALTVRAPGGD